MPSDAHGAVLAVAIASLLLLTVWAFSPTSGLSRTTQDQVVQPPRSELSSPIPESTSGQSPSAAPSGTENPPNESVTGTIDLANGSYENGTRLVPTTVSGPALWSEPVVDPVANSIAVGGDMGWIAFFNSTSWKLFHWLYLASSSQQIFSAAFDPVTNLSYYSVQNWSDFSGTLFVVNDTTGQRVTDVGVSTISGVPGEQLQSLAASTSGQVLYAAWVDCAESCTVGTEAINLTTFHDEGRLALATDVAGGSSVGEMSWISRSDILAVTIPGLGEVEMVNYSNPEEPYVSANISFASPNGIVYDSIDNLVLLAGNGSFAAYDASTGALAWTQTIPVGHSIAWDPESDMIWFAAENGSLYSYYASNGTVASVFPIAREFAYLGLDSQSQTALVGTGYGEVIAVSLASGAVLARVWTGGFSTEDVAYDPENGDLYVSTVTTIGDTWGNRAPYVVITPNGDIVAELTTISPFYSIYDPLAGGMIGVESDGLSLISSTNNTIVQNATGFNPSLLPGSGVFDPASGDIFIALAEYSPLGTLVFNGTTLAVMGNVSFWGASLTTIPSLHEVIGADYYGPELGELQVINSSTDQVVATVQLPIYGCSPTAMAYDPANGLLYVGCFYLASLFAFNVQQRTWSYEAALPSVGVYDLVYDPAVSGILGSSMTSSSIYFVSTATRQFVESIPVDPDPIGLAVDPSTGNVFVATCTDGTVMELTAGLTIESMVALPGDPIAGQAMSISVVVSLGNTSPPLTFNYTGLPPGCGSVDAAELSCVPSTSGTFTITVSVTAFSGSSAVDSLLLFIAPPLEITGFQVFPGVVTLGGAISIWVNVTGGWGPLVVSLSGLPPGCAATDVSYEECTPSLPGTYVMKATVNDSAGTPESATELVEVQPLPLEYTVSFEESGLPPGAIWSISWNGSHYSTNSTFLNFSATNGSYTYEVGTPPGYSVTPTTGVVQVQGQPVPIAIVFDSQQLVVPPPTAFRASSETNWAAVSLLTGLGLVGLVGIAIQLRRRTR